MLSTIFCVPILIHCMAALWIFKGSFNFKGDSWYFVNIYVHSLHVHEWLKQSKISRTARNRESWWGGDVKTVRLEGEERESAKYFHFQQGFLQWAIFKHLFPFYHPRMRIGNNFTWVCLSVCVSVQVITFELLKVGASVVVHRYISRSSLRTKVIRSRLNQ